MGRFWSGMNEVNGEDRSVESAGLLGDCENWRLIVKCLSMFGMTRK